MAISCRPSPCSRSPSTGFLMERFPQTSVCFSHHFLPSTVSEGYVWLSVPHVSACSQRFEEFTRICEKYPKIATGTPTLSVAIAIPCLLNCHPKPLPLRTQNRMGARCQQERRGRKAVEPRAGGAEAVAWWGRSGVWGAWITAWTPKRASDHLAGN